MSKIQDAQAVLKALGLPVAQQNEISALTLLALVSVGPNDPWSSAKRERRGVSKDIMAFIAEHYGRAYKPNTRETVRRQVLHQLVQACVADYNPFEPDLATNSPRAHYAVSEATLAAIQTFGSDAWDDAALSFVVKHGSLAATYAGHRSRGSLVPVTLPDGRVVEPSPGRHNTVQKAIIEEFAPRFAAGSELLYLGDTAKKNVLMEAETLAKLGLPISDHGKLPDIVLFDRPRGWIFLIEAVTSHGPMTGKRVFELAEWLRGGSVEPIYVTAFPDMAQFRRHMKNIAWDTEIWIADTPDHMIHFNGDRFLGPRTSG